MKNLANAIKARQGVLFVGSGATKTEGGASWKELADYVAKECRVEPSSSSPIDILDELCTFGNRRQEVYGWIQKKLSNVSAGPKFSSILDLPWLTIFTTNYDTAIEDHYRSSGAVRPKVMSGAELAVDFGVPNELLVFKLRGSRNIPSGETGEMVISSIDVRRHQREEMQIYEHLNGAVHARVILAIGYSFEDEVLLDAIEQVRSLRSQSNILVYALFRPGTTNPRIEKLKKLGVRIIEGEVSEFSERLTREVGVARGEQTISARCEGRSLSLRPAAIRDALASFDIVTEEECLKPIPIEEFLRGRTSHAGAYEANLPWLRKALKTARTTVDQWTKDRKSECLVVNFKGRPGCGRTVASNDLLHYVVSRHCCIGIRSPQRSPRLDSLGASQLIKHVLDDIGDRPVPFLATLIDEHVSLPDVFSFAHEIDPRGSGLLMIRSSPELLPERDAGLGKVAVRNISVDDGITDDEVVLLRDYIFGLPLELRKRNWTEEDVEYAIRNDPSFLELMFRLVDPAKRSIREIVLTEYSELDGKARKLITYLAAPSSYRIGMPLSLAAKLMAIDIPEMYPLLDQCNKLVRTEEDGLSMPYVYLYHHRVGDILLDLPQVNASIGSSFEEMVKNSNMRSGCEQRFASELLVGRPLSRSPVSELISDEKQIIRIFELVRSRGASRLILHHYGLKLRTAGRYEDAIKVLKEAIDVGENTNNPTERIEIVETSLAHVKWLWLKEKNPDINEDDPQIHILREEIKNSRTKTRWNPHSYGVEVTILQDVANRAPLPRRMELLGEALGLLQEGLQACGGVDSFITDRIREVIEMSRDFTERDAQELLEQHDDGHGYYILDEKNPGADKNEQSTYLRKAADSPTPCPPAMRKMIHIELMKPSPDYVSAKSYSDRLVKLQAEMPNRFKMHWRDHLQRIVCLLGTGNGKAIAELIFEVRRAAPNSIPQPFPYHLRSGGRRTEYVGMVKEVSSSTVATIDPHSVPGLDSILFFNPVKAKTPATFRPGDRVKFTLAIGIYGLQAWDIELDA